MTTGFSERNASKGRAAVPVQAFTQSGIASDRQPGDRCDALGRLPRPPQALEVAPRLAVPEGGLEAEDHRLGVAVASAATTVARDARSRLDTLRRMGQVTTDGEECPIVDCYTPDQFKAIAKTVYQDKNALTAFFGQFNFWAALACLAIQLLLTSRFLRGFGLGPGLLVVPLALFGGELAVHLGRVGHEVRLWARDPRLVDEIAARRANAV